MVNDAIQPLERDRLRLLRALEALEQHAEQLVSGEAPCEPNVGDFSRFFRLFGDIHFATKVDEILLPDLVRCKAGLDMDLVSQIRAAHELQQYHVRTMEQYADSSTQRDDDSRRALCSLVESFVESQRQVCATLENSVFPLIDAMTPDEQQDLKVELEQFDRASIGRRERADLVGLFERIMGSEAVGAAVSSRGAPELSGTERVQSGMISE